jgi:hypothetical protein
MEEFILTPSLHYSLFHFQETMIRRFIIGFGIGLLIFIAINLLSAHLNSDCGLLAVFERDACADDIARAGWPLAFYERGGFAYRFEFLPPVLLLDIAIGIISAGILGWIAARRGR